MPDGRVVDPRLNAMVQGDNPDSPEGSPEDGFKDYGFLVEKESGHNVMYLKDETAQFLTQGSPVRYNRLELEIQINGINYRLDLAVLLPDENPEATEEKYPAVRIQNEAIRDNFSRILPEGKVPFSNSLPADLEKQTDVQLISAHYKRYG